MVAMFYECPVCDVQDRHAYLRCNRPDCLDGRDQASHYSDEARYPAVIKRGGERLPPGWDIEAVYAQKMRWLKWTVIFPCMLVLVIALWLLFTHKAQAGWRDYLPSMPKFCKHMMAMPPTCESVKTYVERYGTTRARWMAKACGAHEADLKEASECLKRQ